MTLKKMEDGLNGVHVRSNETKVSIRSSLKFISKYICMVDEGNQKGFFICMIRGCHGTTFDYDRIFEHTKKGHPQL